MKHIAWMVAALAVGSCAPLGGRSADAESELPWRLSEEPVLSIGAVLGPESEVFGHVAGVVRLGSGTVVVADRGSADLRYFDRDGELLRRAGGEGRGPREFLAIKEIHRCGGDSIFVLDARKPYLSVWSPEGEFGRTLPLYSVRSGESALVPRSFACGDSGTLVFLAARPHRPIPGPHRPTVPVLLMAPDGSVRELGEFPDTERYFVRGRDGRGGSSMPRPLGKRTAIAAGEERLYVGTGDRFEVAVFSLEGERVGTLRDTVTPAPVTDDRIEEYVERRVAGVEEPARRRCLGAFWRELEYPGRAPAYRDVRVGEDGNVWIEEFRMPGEPQRWRIYAPDGERLAVLEMPDRFRLMAAGEDHVLGIRRDVSEVEFVHMYRILKGGG